jgi:hypothetical protein
MLAHIKSQLGEVAQFDKKKDPQKQLEYESKIVHNFDLCS